MDVADHVARIEVPSPALVLLVGVAGAGKSTFAAQHFAPTEVVSSDVCRGLVADDVNDQAATAAAFDVVHRIVHHRLAAGRFTVVDATNLTREGRRQLRDLATRHNTGVAAIVLDVGSEVLAERNATRPERTLPPDRLARQIDQLHRAVVDLADEKLVALHHLRSVAAVNAVTVARVPLEVDVGHRRGPFDIVGDVHGCAAELVELVTALGYPVIDTAAGPRVGHHPDGRTLVFVGDVVDRGPAVAETLAMVMAADDAGVALVALGNHEEKLARALRGRNVRINNGLRTSLDALAQFDEQDRASIAGWIESLPTHLVLDGGALVVAHAGLAERFHGRRSGAERRYAIYGDVTGGTDAHGNPERRDWAASYTGRALVVYGHTPIPRAVERNNTVCVDTGCVFGGQLSALRYPEREVVSVPAQQVWWAPRTAPAAAS
jgi:predicted kinase